ncbi:MAG: cobalamin-binding protein [Gammaproteobacteria bacterium]
MSWDCFGACVAAVSAIDDTGQKIQLSQPARRIISLAPHVTELLFAAGAGDRIVAVTEFSDYPPAARALPRIGDSVRLDRERIVMLKPDLVVAWGSGNQAADLEALRKFGIPLFISEPRQPEDIPRQLESLGTLAGTPETAGKRAKMFRDHLAALRAEYAGRETVSVFFQVAGRPLMTINGEHLISGLLELCGGRNLFGKLSSLAPSVSREAVINLAPEVILYSEYPGNEAADLKLQWDPWQTIPAVKKRQIYGIPVDLIHRAGPRVLEGAERLCAAVDRARR